jgi:hypothetical protein
MWPFVGAEAQALVKTSSPIARNARRRRRNKRFAETITSAPDRTFMIVV